MYISLINSTHARQVSHVSDCRFRSRKFISQLGLITYVEINHEIISMVILPLLLIQKVVLGIGQNFIIDYWFYKTD